MVLEVKGRVVASGDRNTRYFHLKTINHCRCNTILMLRNNEGNWVEEVKELKVMANNFYKDLFSDNVRERPMLITNTGFPRLENIVLLDLYAPVTSVEVHKAICSMDPWKAPGSDRFLTGFFQQSWDVVGDSVTSLAAACCNCSVNKTDICLIPKVGHPEFISQFRPISLCNTIYKVVTKVIVNRLKGIIPDIISPF